MTNEELKKLEDDLWDSANNLRANSDLKSSEYATPVLGIIFLKFADNKYTRFEEEIEKEYKQSQESRRKREKHEIAIEKCGFYLPNEARYDYLLETPDAGREIINTEGKRELQTIDKLIKKAMNLIEEYQDENFKDVLPKDEYFRLADKPEKRQIIPSLLKTFNNIPKDANGDVFGKIYEYFLGNFAMAEGQKGGEFFTPTSVVRLIVEVIEPYYKTNIHTGDRIRIYDPACGSGGMFVQSAKFIENSHLGTTEQIFVYGQEKTGDTVKLAKMNLLVNGLQGQIMQANSYADDPFKGYGQFDYVMANPPFNVKSVKEDTIKHDRRFTQYGFPRNASAKKGDATVPDANYLWISLFTTSLNDKGRAGFVMANSASDARNSEYEIRKKLIEGNIVDAMLTMPSNMFYTVTLPATLWFLDKGKAEAGRTNQVLFIDARNTFKQIDRAHREFTEEQQHNLATIARLYRGENRRFVELTDSYIEQANENIKPTIQSCSEFLEIIYKVNTNLKQYVIGNSNKLSKNQQEKLDEYNLKDKLKQLLKIVNSEKLNIPDKLNELAKVFYSSWLKKVALENSYKAVNTNQHQIAAHLKAIKKAFKEAKKLIDNLHKQIEEHLRWTDKELKLKGDKSWGDLGLNKAIKELEDSKNDFLDNMEKLVYYADNLYWLQNHFPEAEYTDVIGLCNIASLERIQKEDYSLNAGRYVGVAVEEDNLTEEEFKEEMLAMHNELANLNKEAAELENQIMKNIKELLG